MSSQAYVHGNFGGSRGGTQVRNALFGYKPIRHYDSGTAAIAPASFLELFLGAGPGPGIGVPTLLGRER